jgi:hypothetical protein
MVGYAYQPRERLDMSDYTNWYDAFVAQPSDMFALMIALLSVNLVLLVAFRRVYVLERRLRRYEGYYDAR